MILPTKHVKFTESMFGLGGYILKNIHVKPKTIDQLWDRVRKLNEDKAFDAYHSFDNLILTLNFLYIIGAIDIDSEERIYNAIIKTSVK